MVICHEIQLYQNKTMTFHAIESITEVSWALKITANARNVLGPNKKRKIIVSILYCGI